MRLGLIHSPMDLPQLQRLIYAAAWTQLFPVSTVTKEALGRWQSWDGSGASSGVYLKSLSLARGLEADVLTSAWWAELRQLLRLFILVFPLMKSTAWSDLGDKCTLWFFFFCDIKKRQIKRQSQCSWHFLNDNWTLQYVLNVWQSFVVIDSLCQWFKKSFDRRFKCAFPPRRPFSLFSFLGMGQQKDFLPSDLKLRWSIRNFTNFLIRSSSATCGVRPVLRKPRCSPQYCEIDDAVTSPIVSSRPPSFSPLDRLF